LRRLLRALARLDPHCAKEAFMQNRAKRRFLQQCSWALGFVAAAGTALLPCGCTTISEYFHNGFKVGPNYQSPPVPLTPAWIDQNHPQLRPGNPYIESWWDVFGDPILTGLIQRSYLRNLSLRAAAFQILEARAQRAIAVSELLPQSQSYNLQYTHGEVSANGGNAAAAGAAFGASLAPSTSLNGVNPTIGSSIGGSLGGANAANGRFFDNVATSFNLSWEIDFWGLFRRNLEAADASLDQSIDNYDQALVLLLANVATQYVEIRTLQRRLELARNNVALQEPLVREAYQQYKVGAANSIATYHQLNSNLENTKALIPQLEILLRQANNQLCTLLGIPMRDLLPELGDGTIPDPADPTKRIVRIPRPTQDSVVVGIPGELLLRRPDVRAAEDQVRAQSAEIGIAEAEMLPHMGINGSIGLAASNLSKLFNSRSQTATIGPSLTWNILNYGRLLANVRFQNALYQQLVATYQNTILTANQDAENALVAYLRSLDQSAHLAKSADSAAKLTDYLLGLRKEGALPAGAATLALINQFFTAINFQVTQQDAAAQVEGNIALNLILLYRALGGGWQIRLADGGPSACADMGPDDFSLPVTAPQLPPPSELLPEPLPEAELLPLPKEIP
jgi:NodT family efflux transporter outer membrane factor (OMF) lipoprotein